MRAVVQRVHRARVEVARVEVARVEVASEPAGSEVVGAIERGLAVFLGVGQGDGESDLRWTLGKVVGLRVFPRHDGRMGHSVAEVGGALLVVSQFTLYGDVSKGLRPSYGGAMEPEAARAWVDRFVAGARAEGLVVATGRFGAHMNVFCDNDGPVTIWLDSREGRGPR